MKTITRRETFLRGAQAAAAAAVILPTAALAIEAVGLGNDRKLLKLWQRHEAATARMNDPLSPDDDHDAAWEEECTVTELILSTPASGPAGIAVKLKLAVEYEELDKDVIEHPKYVMPRAVISALADAGRLAS